MEPHRSQYTARRTAKRWFMDQRIGRIGSDGNWHCAHCANIYQYRTSVFIESHLRVEHCIGLGQEGDFDCVVIEGFLVCMSGTPLLTPPKWYMDASFGEHLDDAVGDGYWQCAMCTQSVELGKVETPRTIKWHLWTMHHIYGLEDPGWGSQSRTPSLETEVMAAPVVDQPNSPGSGPIATAPLDWRKDASVGTEFTDERGIWWWSCAACPQTFMRDIKQMHRIKDHLEKEHQIWGVVTGFTPTGNSTFNAGWPQGSDRSSAPECVADDNLSATGTVLPGAPIVPEPDPNWMNHYTVGNVRVDESGVMTWHCAWCKFTCPRTHPAEISNHLKRLHEISDIFPTLRSSFTRDMVDPLCIGGLADLPHGHWVYHPSVGSEYIDDGGLKRWACAWCPKTFARTGAVRMLSHLRDAHSITDIKPMPGTPGGACYPQIPGAALIPDQDHPHERSPECLLPDTPQIAIEQEDLSSPEPPEPSDVLASVGTINQARINNNYYIEQWPSSEIDKASSPRNDCANASPTPAVLESFFKTESLPLLTQLGIEQRPMHDEDTWSVGAYDEDNRTAFDMPSSDVSEISEPQAPYDRALPGEDQLSFAIPYKVPDSVTSTFIVNGAAQSRPEHDIDFNHASSESKVCRMTSRTNTDSRQNPQDWQFQKAGTEQFGVHSANGECMPTASVGQRKQKRVASQQLTPGLVPMTDSTLPSVAMPCGSVKKGRLSLPGQSWVFDPRLGSYYRDEQGNGRWRCAICSHNLQSRNHQPIMAHLRRQHHVEHAVDFHAPGCSCFEPAPNPPTKKPKVNQKRQPRQPWFLDPLLGTEYIDRSGKEFWRCNRCLQSFRSWGSRPIIKHLREAHDIHDKPRLEDELGERGPTTDGAWIFHPSVGSVFSDGDGKIQWRCAWCPATMSASNKAQIMYHLRRLHDIEDIMPDIATNHTLANTTGDLPLVLASANVPAAGQEAVSDVNPKAGGRHKHGWVVHPSVGSEIINQAGVRIWRCAWCPRAIAYKSGCQIVRHLGNTHNIDAINPASGGGLYAGGFPHDLLTARMVDEAVSVPSNAIERPLGEYRFIAPNPGQTCQSSQGEDAFLGPQTGQW